MIPANPVEYANYQSLPDEGFGGERCSVIRSIPGTSSSRSCPFEMRNPRIPAWMEELDGNVRISVRIDLKRQPAKLGGKAAILALPGSTLPNQSDKRRIHPARLSDSFARNRSVSITRPTRRNSSISDCSSAAKVPCLAFSASSSNQKVVGHPSFVQVPNESHCPISVFDT